MPTAAIKMATNPKNPRAHITNRRGAICVATTSSIERMSHATRSGFVARIAARSGPMTVTGSRVVCTTIATSTPPRPLLKRDEHFGPGLRVEPILTEVPDDPHDLMQG